MKRFLLFCAVLLLVAGNTASAMTYGLSAYQTMRGSDLSRSPADFFYRFVNEVEGLLEGSSGLGYLYFTPTDTEPGTTEGLLYADDSENILKYYTGGAWVSLGSGTFTGGNITSDITLAADGIDILADTTTAHTYSIGVRDVDAGAYVDVLDWTNANTPAIVLGNTSSTLAISSSGGLNVTTAGVVTGVTNLTMSGTLSGITNLTITGTLDCDAITLGNDGTIDNSTDTEIYFGEATEDIGWDFTSNTVTWKSGTGVVTMGFGDVDALTGINTIAMDAAASSITLTSDSGDDDFTVGLAGATDSSLILSSTGTNADALQITTSAGGIDITNGGASGTEDLDIVSTNASIHLTSGEDATDSINLDSTGGFQLDTTDDITITLASTGDTEDMTLQLTGATNSSILLTSAGTGADAIGLGASAGTVKISGDQLDLDTTNDFNLTVTSSTAAEDLSITQTGGTDSSILIASSGTGADAISLQASAGSMDIDVPAANDVDIAGGQVLISSKDSAANAIALTANVGASETIVVTNTQGTSEAAVSLIATAGGINLDANAAKNITLDGGQVDITSLENTAAAISLNTNVGTSETIVISNGKGSGTDAINVDASAGGIDVDATDDIAITVTSSTGGEDLLLTQTGGTDSSITLASSGTGADAIGLQASAGGVDIDSAATFDTAINGGQVLIESADDVASSIQLLTNNGTSETIVVTNTQGQGAGAITLTATAGGITLTPNASSEVLLNGPVGIGDDTTLTFGANDDATIQYDEDGSDGLQVTGVMYGWRREVEVIQDANQTLNLTRDPSGKVFYVEGNDGTKLDIFLPSMAAAQDGWTYTFVDANEAAGSDVSLDPNDSDSINGTAGLFSSDGNDELPCAVTIMYVDSVTDWVVISIDELDDGTAAWDCD